MEFQVIKLKRMELKNFKMAKLVNIDFDDKLTEILGTNSSGKSTILDAFTFAFLGTNRFGKSSFDAVNRDNNFCSVLIVYEDEDGKINEIERTQTLSPKGVASNNIYLNGERITATKARNMFDKDLFLSIVSPKYFDSLSPAKAKDILLDLSNIDTLSVKMELCPDTNKLLEEYEKLNSSLAKEYKTKNNSEVKKLEAENDILKNFIIDDTIVLRNYEEEILTNMKHNHININKKVNDFIENVESLNKPSKESKLLEILELKSGSDYIEKISVKRNDLMQKIKLNREVYKENLQKIVEYKDKNKALDEYINTELYLLSNELNSILDKSKIIIKDEKDKFVFEKYYDNNTTTISSNSEGIKFGIDLSKLLSFKSGLVLPVFIDDAESIVTLEKDDDSERQMISMAVERNLDLSVVEDNLVKDLNTLETFPRKNINTVFVYRLYEDDCVEHVF